MKEEPSILVDQPSFSVINKPPMWTCTAWIHDGKDLKIAQDKMIKMHKKADLLKVLKSPKPEQLECYMVLKNMFFPSQEDPSTQFGLCHRLDANTSGPIIIGKT